MRTTILVLALISLSAFADDSRYNQVRDSIFWPQLYDDAYQTLYCGAAQAAGDRG